MRCSLYWMLLAGGCVRDAVCEETLAGCRQNLAECLEPREPWVTPEERAVLGEVVEELRSGVVAVDGSVGLCRIDGEACSEMQGLKAGPLPPGKYQLVGRFLAPRVEKEGGWRVQLKRVCTGPSGVASSAENQRTILHEREGTPLALMGVVKSPGAEESVCTYSLGLETLAGFETLEGGYTVPARR